MNAAANPTSENAASDTSAFSSEFATQRRERFENAWVDLGERIRSGVKALEGLIADTDGTSTAIRRRRKQDGLADAARIWRRIDLDSRASADLDWAFWAWQEQRTLVLDAYLTRMQSGLAGDADVAAGLCLSLDYMSGYGHDVDVPSLSVLLAGIGGGRA